jgi:ABC-type sugar transport system ATPase subunit
VGSPAINLLPGGLLPGGAQTVGIRPEDVVLADDGPIECSVVLCEHLGAHQLLTLRNDSIELRALVPASWTHAARVRVRLDPARAHLFDDAGRRLAGERL